MCSLRIPVVVNIFSVRFSLPGTAASSVCQGHMDLGHTGFISKTGDAAKGVPKKGEAAKGVPRRFSHGETREEMLRRIREMKY